MSDDLFKGLDLSNAYSMASGIQADIERQQREAFAAVNAASEERLMQTLRETLTPDQLDLVMEVIIKGRKLSDYAAEQQVSKSAITQRMNTIKKKLKKILF